jgi:hypothetical protein
MLHPIQDGAVKKYLNQIALPLFLQIVPSIYKQVQSKKYNTMIHIFSTIVLASMMTSIAACPLSIAIVDTIDHTIQVSVTNTGAETIAVFKGNTIFSDHPTKDLLVIAAGKHPSFT